MCNVSEWCIFHQGTIYSFPEWRSENAFWIFEYINTVLLFWIAFICELIILLSLIYAPPYMGRAHVSSFSNGGVGKIFTFRTSPIQQIRAAQYFQESLYTSEKLALAHSSENNESRVNVSVAATILSLIYVATPAEYRRVYPIIIKVRTPTYLSTRWKMLIGIQNLLRVGLIVSFS